MESEMRINCDVFAKKVEAYYIAKLRLSQIHRSCTLH